MLRGAIRTTYRNEVSVIVFKRLSKQDKLKCLKDKNSLHNINMYFSVLKEEEFDKELFDAFKNTENFFCADFEIYKLQNKDNSNFKSDCKKFNLFIKFNCIEESLKNNGNWISFIENQTEEMQMEAIINGAYLYSLKNPSEEIQFFAVKKFYGNFKWVENPSEEFIYKCLKESCEIIKFIDNPTIEMQMLALEYGAKIEMIKNIDLNLLIKIKEGFSKNKLIGNVGKFNEMNVNEEVCKGCEVVCTYKHSSGLFDGCPRFLEHIALKKN